MKCPKRGRPFDEVKVEVKNLIEELKVRYGDSSDESRKAVVEAHGGYAKMKLTAEIWATHHSVITPDIFVAYATAVELGYRMARPNT